MSLHQPPGVGSQSLSTGLRHAACSHAGLTWGALTIADHRGNAKQSHSEMSLTLLGWLSSERQETTTAGEDAEKRQPPLPVGTKTGAAIMENGMEAPAGIKSGTTI